ncbi:MAG: Gfo/Idh/MocA family oxidoreductase, partial [Chloroflexi bacterium]
WSPLWRSPKLIDASGPRPDAERWVWRTTCEDVPVINVALLGAGYWGSNLCRVLAQSKRFNLKWVSDLNPATLERARRLAPMAQMTTDPSAPLGDPAVSAVVLATPVASHATMALRALDAGKHVLVEKPLAASAAEAEQICLRAERLDRRLMVGHTFMYNRAVREVKAIIDSGTLGEIYYVFCRRLQLGIVRQDVDALWNLAPHDVSIMNFWIDRPIESVASVGQAWLQSNIADVVFAHLNYAGNVAGHIHVSWLDPNKVRQVTVVGSRKMLIFDDMARDAPIQIFDKGVEIENIDANLGTFETYAQHRLIVRAGDVWLRHVDIPEPLDVELTEFADSIQEGRAPLTDGRKGLEVVRILERLTKAMNLEQTRLSLVS